MAIELSAPTRFEENAFYERLLDIRRTDRAKFERLSPVSRLALMQYEKLKRAAEEAGASNKAIRDTLRGKAEDPGRIWNEENRVRRTLAAEDGTTKPDS
jgi:hypothetical protein